MLKSTEGIFLGINKRHFHTFLALKAHNRNQTYLVTFYQVFKLQNEKNRLGNSALNDNHSKQEISQMYASYLYCIMLPRCTASEVF